MAIATYGDLRKQLATEGIQWTVNPALKDTALINQPALGGDPTHFTLAKDAAMVDVAKLVAANPTTNVLLRAHLVNRGLLPASLAPTVGITTARTALPELKLAVATELKLARPIAGAAVLSPAASGGAGGSGLPASVDWRNRWTWNFVTGIRDQDPCEHCWIYAPTALVECMVRIEHCVWCDRSEGDYIEANKVICGQCGGAGAVLDWYAKNGVADQACVPWVDSDPGNRSSTYWNPAPQGCGGGSKVAPPAYAPVSNRSGKIVKIPAYTTLGDVTAQKNWLDAIGPLVCSMEIYTDFSGWSGSKPYIKSATATDRGSHVMLIVGYDDNLKCWIVKNSWGPGWGNGGFGLIGYGQCNIDTWSKLGLQYTSPDPWTKRREHSGGMIESGNGNLHRNFELLARTKGNAFTHYWRDNQASGTPWHKDVSMANDVATDVTLTATTYNRNFETIYRTTANRLHHWYFDQASSKWVDGPIFGPTNVQGSVGFCESDYGTGNFEVVVAVAGGTMEHWFRVGGTWAKSVTFGSGVATAGPSLLQSSWGPIEFVATNANGTMQHWYRSGTNWIGDQIFGSGVKSHACMIQGQFGYDVDNGNGNFELCVAMPNGTVQHWWRSNASPFPWTLDATFGSGISMVVSLLQGSFGFNLEMIVLRTDGQLQHYWRDDGGWHAGVLIGSTL